MDAKKTAQQVLEQVGGAENVAFLTHCVTRLRFNLRSMDGVDDAKVKAVPGVVGVPFCAAICSEVCSSM